MTRPIEHAGQCYVRQQPDGLWAVYITQRSAELDQFPSADDYDERALALAYAEGYTQGSSDNR